MVFDSDSFRPEPDISRGACRCPRCKVIWTHYESEDDPNQTLKSTAAYIKTHYGSDKPYQCPECGTWSILRNRKVGFWEAALERIQWRIIVPPPETARASAGREEEPDRG